MTDALDLPDLKAARAARREFLDRLEPLRSDLYKYCRRLTGNAVAWLTRTGAALLARPRTDACSMQ